MGGVECQYPRTLSTTQITCVTDTAKEAGWADIVVTMKGIEVGVSFLGVNNLKVLVIYLDPCLHRWWYL